MQTQDARPAPEVKGWRLHLRWRSPMTPREQVLAIVAAFFATSLSAYILYHMASSLV